MFPNALTVWAWQVAQSVSVIVGACDASAGGSPWHEPQYTLDAPLAVQLTEPVPWQYAFVHVPLVELQLGVDERAVARGPHVSSAGSSLSI
jgi:hypothetical protein